MDESENENEEEAIISGQGASLNGAGCGQSNAPYGLQLSGGPLCLDMVLRAARDSEGMKPVERTYGKIPMPDSRPRWRHNSVRHRLKSLWSPCARF